MAQVGYNLGPGFYDSLKMVGDAASGEGRDLKKIRKQQVEQADIEHKRIMAEEKAIEAIVPMMEEQGIAFVQRINNARTNKDYGLAYLLSKRFAKSFSGGEPGDPASDMRTKAVTRGGGPGLLAEAGRLWTQTQEEYVDVIDFEAMAAEEKAANDAGATYTEKIIFKRDDDGEIAQTTVGDAIQNGKLDYSSAAALFSKTKDWAAKQELANLWDLEIDPNDSNKLLSRERTKTYRAHKEHVRATEERTLAHAEVIFRTLQAGGGMTDAQAHIAADYMAKEFDAAKYRPQISFANAKRRWGMTDPSKAFGDQAHQLTIQAEDYVIRKNSEEIALSGTGLSSAAAQQLRVEFLRPHEIEYIGPAGASTGTPVVEMKEKIDLAANNPMSSSSLFDKIYARLDVEHAEDPTNNPAPTPSLVYAEIIKRETDPKKKADIEKYIKAKAAWNTYLSHSLEHDPDIEFGDVAALQGELVNVEIQHIEANYVSYLNTVGLGPDGDAPGKAAFRDRLTKMSPEERKKLTGTSLSPIQMERSFARYMDIEKGMLALLKRSKTRPGPEHLMEEWLLGIPGIKSMMESGEFATGMLEEKTGKVWEVVGPEHDTDPASIMERNMTWGLSNRNVFKGKKGQSVGDFIDYMRTRGDDSFKSINPEDELHLVLTRHRALRNGLIHSGLLPGVDLDEDYHQEEVDMEFLYFMNAVERKLGPEAIEFMSLGKAHKELRQKYLQTIPSALDFEKQKVDRDLRDGQIKMLEQQIAGYELFPHIQDLQQNEDWYVNDRRAYQGVPIPEDPNKTLAVKMRSKSAETTAQSRVDQEKMKQMYVTARKLISSNDPSQVQKGEQMLTYLNSLEEKDGVVGVQMP